MKNCYLIKCSERTDHYDVVKCGLVRFINEVCERNLCIIKSVRQVVLQILVVRVNNKKICPFFKKLPKDLLIAILNDVWKSRFDHSFWLKEKH
jgi:hypothetical protein